MSRRKITNEMLAAVAQRIFERVSTAAIAWDKLPSRMQNKYMDAAHSVLLLADDYWQEKGQ